MGPRNAYKDMLDNVVSPIACVDMNHQNQLEQMANEAMFTTASGRPIACARAGRRGTIGRREEKVRERKT
jgi:hypothetical protein